MSILSNLFNKNNKTFNIVKIGNQEWMSENLNAIRFRNGNLILETKTDEEWVKAGRNRQPAWCYYGNNPSNGKKYGKLYNWYAVNNPGGLAPNGWHVPGKDEWNALVNLLGGKEKAGTEMKLDHGWGDGSNGNNSSGFSGLPGGYRSYDDGTFGAIGDYGTWWSSTEHSLDGAWAYGLGYGNIYVEVGGLYKQCGYSVRCLRD